MLDLIKDAIRKRANEALGFLIDGFPRQVEQGKTNKKRQFPLLAKC